MSRRLRVAQVTVQVALVWDDGDELEPGPDLSPITVPLSRLPHLVETLPGEVAALAERLDAEQTAEQ